MFWVGFIGCADTMAGSSVWFSKSNIESYKSGYNWITSNNIFKVTVNSALLKYTYLYEIIGSLHLCHKILYSLPSHKWIWLSHWSQRVGLWYWWRCSLRLLLEWVYHLKYEGKTSSVFKLVSQNIKYAIYTVMSKTSFTQKKVGHRQMALG